MIHSHDEDSLKRILGVEDVPSDILAEYLLWQQMYHRDGNSGALGTLGLIALARSLGKSPPSVSRKTEGVDWRNVPQDGTARVEARFFGGWQTGVFLGFVSGGSLAVKLDHDDVVRECYPAIVRLSEEAPAEQAVAVFAAEAVIEDLSNLAPDGPVTEPLGIGQWLEPMDDDEAFNWGQAKPGDPVWVENDKFDFENGQFQGICEDSGLVKVLLDGESECREVRLDSVTYAGDPPKQG